MLIKTWLSDAESKLKKSNIATARLDALVLLSDVLHQDKAWILANFTTNITMSVTKKLNEQVDRRAKHEPLAYIRGRSEFYGRNFLVTPDTLQPRPETETMIELFKKIGLTEGVIVDVGTGSGAIAITIKLENPKLEVHATEINKNALVVAKKNTERRKANVNFYKGNLLKPVRDLETDALLCNLPYVPDSHTINEAAMQEPKIAIFGGKDGLDLYRDLFRQVKTLDHKPKFILTESLPFQHGDLASIAYKHNYSLEQTEDFIQVFTLVEKPQA